MGMKQHSSVTNQSCSNSGEMTEVSTAKFLSFVGEQQSVMCTVIYPGMECFT